MEPAVRRYLAEIGRRGGRKSRRRLTPDVAREMARLRDARRAYRRFHTQCFWSSDPDYRVMPADIPWVAERLMTYGGRAGWDCGARLCR